jgi:hypothetical protein
VGEEIWEIFQGVDPTSDLAIEALHISAPALVRKFSMGSTSPLVYDES